MIRMRGLCFSIALISLPTRSHKAILQTLLRALLQTFLSPYSECEEAREAPLSFVICHLSFFICHSSFDICHLSFVTSFVIRHLSFVKWLTGRWPMTTNDE